MTDYYVSNSGSDPNAGTSPGAAWQTMAKVYDEFVAGTFSRGDTLSFNQGDTFTISSTSNWMRIRNIGGTSGYVTIGAYGTGADPIWDASDIADLSAVYLGSADSNNSWWIIQDIEIRNAGAVLVNIGGADNWIVRRCTLHDTSDKASGSEAAFYIHGNAINWEISDCTIYDTFGEGIYVGTWNDVTDHSGYAIIRDNSISDVGRDAVDLKLGTRNIIVVGNTVALANQHSDLSEDSYIHVGGRGHRICQNTLSAIDSDFGIAVGYSDPAEMTQDIIVEDNLLDGEPLVAISGVQIGYSGATYAQDVIVRRNDIANATYGMRVYTSASIVLRCNILRANVTTGVYISSTTLPDSDENWFANGITNDYYVNGTNRTRASACTNNGLDCNGHDGEPTTTQVTDDDASLAGLWLLEETSGTRYDQTANNNDLTDNNTVLYSSDAKQGTYAADFERDNSEYLSIADTASLSITGAISFGCWLKVESLPGNMTPIGKWTTTGSQRSYEFLVNSTGQLSVLLSADGVTDSAQAYVTDALVIGVWYHITAVYDAVDLRLYIQGFLERNGAYNPDTYTGGIYDSTAAFELGAREGATNCLDGLLDEAFVLSRALTAAEVLYIKENGLTASTPPPATGSVALGATRAALNTGTGTQDFTTTDLGGLTPKFGLCFVSRAIADATAADEALVGVGMVSGAANRGCVSVTSEHGQASVDSNRIGMTDQAICLISPGTGVVDFEADFSAWITNGIRINITNAPTGAYYITWLFVAGDDVSANVVNFTPSNTIDATVDITDIGFEADVLIPVSHLMALNDTEGASLFLSLGLVLNGVAVSQYSCSFYEASGEVEGAPCGRITADYGVMQISSAAAVAWGGEFSAFDAAGVSCTTRIVGAGGDQVLLGALSFGGIASVAGGLRTTPTSTGAEAITAPGFQPQAVLAIMTGMPSLDTAYAAAPQAGVLGLSLMTPTVSYCNALAIEDAADPTDTQVISDDQAVNLPQDDGAAGHAATLTGMTATGWTWNYSATLGTGCQYIWLAIEAVTGEVMPLFQHHYRQLRS